MAIGTIAKDLTVSAGDAKLARDLVKKLRAKLRDDARSPTWIFSVRVVGYRMASPREA